jgi:Nucleotide-diphospho-sugar transferase
MSIQITAEQITSYSNGDTIWTTVTNYGYRLYTLNMLKSLASFNLDRNVVILCIDDKSAEWFRKKGYHVISINTSYERFCAWNTTGYDKICYLKLEWIYRVLTLHKNILLIDGDIVFQKDPSADVGKWEQDTRYDGWVQNDSQTDQNIENLCTGYMFIRSTPKMIELYDCISEAGLEKYKRCAFDNNDQTYFNQYVKPFAKIQPLALSNYPNGKMYMEHRAVIYSNTILVHFNWLKGHMKLAKMKEYKMWILMEEDED